MAWEDRNGRKYYYRKRRDGRRVVSEYVGAGFVGEFAENIDAIERAEGERTRAKWLQMQQSAKDMQARQFEKLTQAIMRAVLLSSGYHTHNGQWRKRRNGK